MRRNVTDRGARGPPRDANVTCISLRYGISRRFENYKHRPENFLFCYFELFHKYTTVNVNAN
jgi:hypothetical protein